MENMKSIEKDIERRSSLSRSPSKSVRSANEDVPITPNGLGVKADERKTFTFNTMKNVVSPKRLIFETEQKDVPKNTPAASGSKVYGL